MKLYLDKLIARKCTGIYIGPDIVIAATSLRTFHAWEVESVSAQVNTEVEAGFMATPQDILTLKDNLNKLVSDNPVSGEIQVAFDDRYVRFFVVPLSEAPDKNEVENILRWQAERVLRNPQQYDYAAQVVETTTGFRIYGAAIMSDFVSAVEEVLQSHNLAWYMADSSAGYAWNSFDEQRKRGAIVYITMGRYGWTLIVSNADSCIELIKPGRWSYSQDGLPQIRSGMVEANRLLTTFLDKQPQAKPERVYVDIGEHKEGMTVVKEFFGYDLAEQAFMSIPLNFSHNVPQQYLFELSVAMKASTPR